MKFISIQHAIRPFRSLDPRVTNLHMPKYFFSAKTPTGTTEQCIVSARVCAIGSSLINYLMTYSCESSIRFCDDYLVMSQLDDNYLNTPKCWLQRKQDGSALVPIHNDRSAEH